MHAYRPKGLSELAVPVPFGSGGGRIATAVGNGNAHEKHEVGGSVGAPLRAAREPKSAGGNEADVESWQDLLLDDVKVVDWE